MRTEAERQAAVLGDLWGTARTERHEGPGWHAQGPVLTRGLAAYQGNANATAERVLAAAYPTVQALLGEEALALLARQCWRRHPPTEGDLTLWGADLPRWLQDLPEAQDWPYLPDCARLDWARHTAEQALDTKVEPESLALLGTHDAHELHLQLRPGLSLIRSSWPVVAIWDAHQPGKTGAPIDPSVLASLRQRLNEHVGENAVVWRAHWRAEVFALPDAMAGWMSALTQAGGASRPSLSTLLDQAASDFDLAQWLGLALQKGWLWRASVNHPHLSGPSD